MVYVGFGVFLKDAIYIGDFGKVIVWHRLAKKAILSKPKKRRLHNQYCKRILGALTTLEKPRWWHLHLINKVLVMADMIAKKVEKKKKKDKKDPLKVLNEMANYAGPRVGMTPDEFLSKITQEQLEPYFKQIVRMQLDEGRAMVMAHHLPNEFLKEIGKGYKALESKAKQIASNTERRLRKSVGIKGFFQAASG